MFIKCIETSGFECIRNNVKVNCTFLKMFFYILNHKLLGIIKEARPQFFSLSSVIKNDLMDAK